jgi:hypothetical protein
VERVAKTSVAQLVPIPATGGVSGCAPLFSTKGGASG